MSAKCGSGVFSLVEGHTCSATHPLQLPSSANSDNQEPSPAEAYTSGLNFSCNSSLSQHRCLKWTSHDWRMRPWYSEPFRNITCNITQNRYGIRGSDQLSDSSLSLSIHFIKWILARNSPCFLQVYYSESGHTPAPNIQAKKNKHVLW